MTLLDTFKEKAKIYLVLEKNTYSMFPRVAPINAVYNNGDGDVIICSYTLDPDTGDVTAAYGLIIRDDKTIGYLISLVLNPSKIFIFL